MWHLVGFVLVMNGLRAVVLSMGITEDLDRNGNYRALFPKFDSVALGWSPVSCVRIRPLGASDAH